MTRLVLALIVIITTPWAFGSAYEELRDAWNEDSNSSCPGGTREGYQIHPSPMPTHWSVDEPFRFQIVSSVSTGGCRHLIYARIVDDGIRQSAHLIHDHKNGTYTVEFIVADAGNRTIEVRIADRIGFNQPLRIERFEVAFDQIFPVGTITEELPLCIGTEHDGRWVRCPVEETALFSPKLLHGAGILTKYSVASDAEQPAIEEPRSVAAFRWQPYECRYHHYDQSELQTCFSSRRMWIHYTGDSVSRDTFHDFPEFLWEAPRVKLHSNVHALSPSNDFLFTFNWIGNSLRALIAGNRVTSQSLAPWSAGPEQVLEFLPESTLEGWRLRSPDVWVFNLGLWDNDPHNIFQWKTDLVHFADVVRTIQLAYPSMRIVWRTITPLAFPAAQFREFNAAAARVFREADLELEIWDAARIVDSENHDHGEIVHFAGVAGRTYSNVLANMLCNE